ncbi:MAG: molybdopterin-dependent oxidoreductase [Sphaerobacter thermophilus]|uniref:xanthine dehydrogenase family protein molybdopterin-binding subunit n=1 Tax=Sphaerobacter thermophilus TaxID=2057 RepID=UPI00396D96F1
MVLSRLVGARVRRKEDPRLITGRATYVDDVRIPGMLYLAFVRSPHPHARIRSINVEQALAMPGVVAVVTGQDLRGILKMTDEIGGEGEDAGTVQEGATSPRMFPMAVDRVRHVGQAVVAVVAESDYQARDAVDAVQVDYETLPAVVDPEAAMQDGAPQLWDELPNNIAMSYDRTRGDVDAAFEAADVVVKQRMINQRLAGVPMEPRGVVAAPDPATGGVTVWSSTQAPHWNRNDIAKNLGLGQNQVRVIAPQVGGGFGVKIGAYAEDFILSGIAYHLQRPVKWIETRSENLMATHQGRAQIADVEVAADGRGKILAYRLNLIQDQGAYPKDTSLGVLTSLVVVGCYDIPAIDLHIRGVCTNTMDVGAYRGAGRPEAAYYIERAIDLIADRTGLDPAEVRRVNFIPPEKFPYTTIVGEIYDSGEYAKALDKALELSGYQQLRQEQAAARQQGRYLGIGLSSYVEICGFGPWESATLRIEPSGAVTVYSGICPQGQGQETVFAQMVADHLGADFDQITVQFGDTATAPQGNGTMGSRGLAVGGGAVMLSIEKIREKLKQIAAAMLEASVDDIELADGRWRVKGAPDKSVTLAQIAAEAYGGTLPADIAPGLETTDFFRPEDETFPFGTHVAVVELMPDTGEVKLLRYVSVDDCGVIMNPMLVEGQVHGGLAQGIAQALLEEVRYDDNGQLLTGTLMDYAVPKATHLPVFETDHTETPTHLNPMGAKGIGEAATIGSTPAVANAVIDALEPLGITHLDMPFTPEKIRTVMQEARP